MLTKEFVIEQIKAGNKKSECIDGRDFVRLCSFFRPDEIHILGYTTTKHYEPKEWTEENIKQELKRDLEFAFEKALNKRGISSSLMYEVIKMWLWILEDPLVYSEDYAYYGLPLYKTVASKYGFFNPIGEDTGEESYYGDEE